MNTTKLIAASLTMMFGLSIADSAQASLLLRYAGNGPILDTDGVVGIGDVDTFSGEIISYEVVTAATDPSGGALPGIWDFTLSILDTAEIVPEFRNYVFNPGLVQALVDVTPTGNSVNLNQTYVVGIPLVNGTVIASFDLETAQPGFRPHDDIGDLSLNSNSATLFDPTLGLISPNSGGAVYDYQTVPEPLTIFGVGTAIAFGTSFKRKLAKSKKK